MLNSTTSPGDIWTRCYDGYVTTPFHNLLPPTTLALPRNITPPFLPKPTNTDDEHKSKWYSNNQLGIYWRWIVNKNPMSLAACFNGGLFGILFSTFKLHSHNQALKLEKGSSKKTN